MLSLRLNSGDIPAGMTPNPLDIVSHGHDWDLSVSNSSRYTIIFRVTENILSFIDKASGGCIINKVIVKITNVIRKYQKNNILSVLSIKYLKYF